VQVIRFTGDHSAWPHLAGRVYVRTSNSDALDHLLDDVQAKGLDKSNGFWRRCHIIKFGVTAAIDGIKVAEAVALSMVR